MSKQAILELLDSNETKYRKTRSRKAKGALLAQLTELTGYKSSKNIIRYYAKKRKASLPKKRGRMAKLHSRDIRILKLLWLKSNQPCGKRLPSMLPTRLHSLSKTTQNCRIVDWAYSGRIIGNAGQGSDSLQSR